MHIREWMSSYKSTFNWIDRATPLVLGLWKSRGSVSLHRRENTSARSSVKRSLSGPGIRMILDRNSIFECNSIMNGGQAVRWPQDSNHGEKGNKKRSKCKKVREEEDIMSLVWSMLNFKCVGVFQVGMSRQQLNV